VSNRVVNGKKCTITWYVNDLKISHVEYFVVDDVIKAIESYFRNTAVTRGLTHKYAGIEIEFTGDGKVTLFQKKDLLKCIETFGEDITTSVASPPDNELLDENRSATFHSFV